MSKTSWVASGSSEVVSGKTDLALGWIKRNRETFIGSAAMLLAVALFAVYFFMHYRDLGDAAWKNLFIAQQMGYGGDTTRAQDQLSAIEASFAGTSAAPYAVMTKGDMLFAQGKYAEAGTEYSKILSSKDLAPFAIYSLGKCKEAAGDMAGAQAQYADFLSKNPEHFMAPEVRASLARAQELSGNKDLAKTTYEKIVLLYPGTSWAARAQAKLEGKSNKGV